MNGQIKMTIGAGLVAAALVVGGGGYYYFHVHRDTPGVAIENLAEALDNHDLREFHRVVNVDSVLDSGYEGFVEGFTASNSAATTEIKDMIRNFTEMLREPMILSVKNALDSYVATGKVDAEKNAGAEKILERVGLNDIEIREVKNLQISDADKNEAFADVIIFQPELGREFPIQVVLTRDDDRWRVTRLQNFQEYVEQITQIRRAQLDEYLAKSGEINSRHEAILREGEQKYGMILSVGNLANDETRSNLKSMIDDVFLVDWQARKQELFGLHVPQDAEPLHNTYMKICDLAIEAAQEYSRWMDDNKSSTIKSAEEKIRQVRALTAEAAGIARRMTS